MTSAIQRTDFDKAKRASAIAQAWEGAESNAQAAQRLSDMMKGDPELWRLVLEPFERQAAEMAVARKKIADRHYVWTRPVSPDQRANALVRANAATLLDTFRLDSGKILGDATQAEVLEAATQYAARAKWNADKSSFLKAVADRVTGNKTVRQVWTAAELEELRDA